MATDINPYLSAFAKFLPATSRYGAVSSSCGALAGFLAPYIGQEVWTAFSLGFLLPIGPMVFYYSRIKTLEAELGQWKRLKEKNAISAAEMTQLRTLTIAAFAAKRYGPSAPSSAKDTVG